MIGDKLEQYTFEYLLEQALEQVPDTIDKREGSIIYDALAPACYKLAEVYMELNSYVDMFFVDTAVGEYLDRKAVDYGMKRNLATHAVRKVETTDEIDLGTRWAYLDTSYIITDLLETNVYRAECEQTGIIGNLYFGELENIDNVLGITATLADVLIAGSETETDEDFRNRIQQYLINPAQDGNVAQYLRWALEYPGVGKAKVFPLWDGGNTVKVAITDALSTPASGTLVADFQEYLDPGSEGLGNGAAPIGAKVTVVSGTQKDINISATIELAEGYSEATGAAEAITQYLANITYDKTSISFMRLGSALLDVDSIAGVSNMTINGVSTDVALVGTEIPVLASLNLTVV